MRVPCVADQNHEIPEDFSTRGENHHAFPRSHSGRCGPELFLDGPVSLRSPCCIPADPLVNVPTAWIRHATTRQEARHEVDKRPPWDYRHWDWTVFKPVPSEREAE